MKIIDCSFEIGERAIFSPETGKKKLTKKSTHDIIKISVKYNALFN